MARWKDRRVPHQAVNVCKGGKNQFQSSRQSSQSPGSSNSNKINANGLMQVQFRGAVHGAGRYFREIGCRDEPANRVSGR